MVRIGYNWRSTNLAKRHRIAPSSFLYIIFWKILIIAFSRSTHYTCVTLVSTDVFTLKFIPLFINKFKTYLHIVFSYFIWNFPSHTSENPRTFPFTQTRKSSLIASSFYRISLTKSIRNSTQIITLISRLLLGLMMLFIVVKVKVLQRWEHSCVPCIRDSHMTISYKIF